MADFDLRALSAPIEALRRDVKAAYARLDERWDEIADEMKKLAIPCTVGYTFDANPYSDEYRRLEWRKLQGKKRFCITNYEPATNDQGDFYETQDVKPYEEWSAEQRLIMLSHIPELFETAPKQIKQFIDKANGVGVQK